MRTSDFSHVRCCSQVLESCLRTPPREDGQQRSTHSATLGGDNLPGIGQLSEAQEDLRRTVRSVGIEETCRNDGDSVGVLHGTHRPGESTSPKALTSIVECIGGQSCNIWVA